MRIITLFAAAVLLSSPVFGQKATDQPDTRLFELRTYHAMPGKLDMLLARFRDHTTGLFEKHGMTNLGYFQPVAGQPGTDDTLLYFLAHKDAASAGESWKAFRSDPAWLAVKKASEDAAGGSLTVPDGVKAILLRPTDFSPVR